jgi:glutathione S-transferase
MLPLGIINLNVTNQDIFDRYVLNFKKLPYKTVYLEFPELKDVLQAAGVPPITTKSGDIFYTSPSIVDDATGAAISDSFKIAEYLDKQYPDTPKAFPPGSKGLQAAFYEQFDSIFSGFVPLMMPQVPDVINLASREYYFDTRPKIFGKPWDQLRPVGEELDKTWRNTKGFFDSMDKWYEESGGPYLMGNAPSFADFAVGAFLVAVKMVNGEDSEEWGKISTWHDGRWFKLVKDLEEFADTEL